MKSLVLGTMTFNWSKASRHIDNTIARQLLDSFASQGGSKLDTALVYMDQPGVAERMLGEIVAPHDGFEIHTKAHPMLGVGGKTDNGATGLSPVNLRAQVEDSLKNLKMETIPLFYLHQPDTQTTLVETLETCNALHKENKISALGMSNYSAKEVREAVTLCRERSWLVPTVYQGNYNVLNRCVEDELLPTLQELGMKFYAYNPLAAGLLSGKYTDKAAVPTTGRFAENKNYLDRYWKAGEFESLDKIRQECDAAGITVLQSAFSWLKFHSMLKDDKEDGVVIGVSSQEQLDQNMAAWNEASPLPEGVLAAMEAAWTVCKPDAFSYYRGFSGAGGDARIGLSL